MPTCQQSSTTRLRLKEPLHVQSDALWRGPCRDETWHIARLARLDALAIGTHGVDDAGRQALVGAHATATARASHLAHRGQIAIPAVGQAHLTPKTLGLWKGVGCGSGVGAPDDREGGITQPT